MNDLKTVSSTPYITYLLIGLCVLFSVSAMLFPELNHIFSGVGELKYGWQPFTAVFIHGFQGLPMLIHLPANMLLLLFCGVLTERLIGSRRFAFLTLGAIIISGIVRVISTVEFNGSSAFIWAYSPIMLLALRQAPIDNDIRSQVGGVIVIMWVVVPVMMAIVVQVGGYKGNILIGFVWGNLYHLTGVMTGTLLGVWWFHSKATLTEDNLDSDDY